MGLDIRTRKLRLPFFNVRKDHLIPSLMVRPGALKSRFIPEDGSTDTSEFNELDISKRNYANTLQEYLGEKQRLTQKKMKAKRAEI